MNIRAKALAACLGLLLSLTVLMPPATALCRSESVPSIDNLTGTATSAKPEKLIGEARHLEAAKDAFMLQLHLVQNHGQLNESIKFYGKSKEHSIYFTENEIYLFVPTKSCTGA